VPILLYNLGIGLLAALVCLICIIAFTHLAPRLKLIDIPDSRKHHAEATPVVGGLAIYTTLCLAVYVLGSTEDLKWLVLSSGILVLVGALDDIFGLSVWIRLAFQIIASLTMLISSSVSVESIGVDVLQMDLVLQTLGVPITIFAVVGLTNGVNMADGIDGLASGYILVALGALFFGITLASDQAFPAMWVIVLGSATFIFALVNLSIIPVKKVFLGDSGSLLLGFTLGWTLVLYSQKPLTFIAPVMTLWCVAIPVFDTVRVVIRRLKLRRSVFRPDRSHLHHILIDRGFSNTATLLIVLGLSIAVGFVGILSAAYISHSVSLFLFLGCMFVFEVVVRHNENANAV